MKFAFFGSSLVSAYWNGAATYYRGIIRAMQKRGHQITFYEPDAYDRQKNRDIEDPSWARIYVYQPTEEEVYKALDDALHADIIIKTSGVGVFDELLEKEVLKLKLHGKHVIFWDVDAPATLDRVNYSEEDYFKASHSAVRFDIHIWRRRPRSKCIQAVGRTRMLSHLQCA